MNGFGELKISLTWFVRNHGTLSISQSERSGYFSITFISRQPRLARKEIVFALCGHIYLYLLHIPATPRCHSIMTDLRIMINLRNNFRRKNIDVLKYNNFISNTKITTGRKKCYLNFLDFFNINCFY